MHYQKWKEFLLRNLHYGFCTLFTMSINFFMNIMLCNTNITLFNISELLFRLITEGQILFSHMSVVIKYLFFWHLFRSITVGQIMVSHCMCVCQVVVHISIEKVEVDGPDFGNDCPALWALWLFMVCHVQSDCLNNLIDKHFLLFITLEIFNHRFKNRQTLFGILNTCNFSRTLNSLHNTRNF